MKNFKNSQDQFKKDKTEVTNYLKKNPGLTTLDFIDEKLDQAKNFSLLSFTKKYGSNYSELRKYQALLKNWRISISSENVNKQKTVSKMKAKRVNDYNKPVLNQEQLVILFYILRSEGVVIKDIDKKEYAEIFLALTGYKSEPFRKLLSQKCLSDFVENKNNFNEVISKLNAIIKILEKEKAN